MPTVFSPSSVAARMTRMAISERFATMSFLIGRIVDTAGSVREALAAVFLGMVGWLGKVEYLRAAIVHGKQVFASHEDQHDYPRDVLVMLWVSGNSAWSYFLP
jgi:hypothetical protein